MARRLIKDKDKTSIKPWNNYKWNKYSNMGCYAMGDRDDHRFECYYDKYGSAISLGVYDNYEDAKEVHIEFTRFIQRERLNVKKCRKLCNKDTEWYQRHLEKARIYKRKKRAKTSPLKK